MSSGLKAILVIALVIGLSVSGIVIGFTVIPALRGISNAQDYVMSKVDEATSYKLKKEVENSCRAMISSYEADKLTYEQYRDSEDKEQLGWADQAKMRANRTASTYNNYILKNSYVWANNVPTDIRESLDILN